MVLIWAGNFSLVKLALREIPHVGFNALRLVLASVIFLGPLSRAPRRPLTRQDWIRIGALGVVGHFVYQICFMDGLARTSVANTTLILACTPVVVTLLTALVERRERVTAMHWAGVGLSVLGIYVTVGRNASMARASLAGDLFLLGAVGCWAVYTVAARPLLERHSPLVVTAYSMMVGTVLYAPLAWPDLQQLAWRAVSPAAWTALVCSAALALCVAYVIWYTAVQQIGNTRTAVYSNMIPIAAMAIAAVWLDEPIGWTKVSGAALVILGVLLTRIGRSMRVAVPAEE